MPKKKPAAEAGAPDLEQLKKDLFKKAKKDGHIDQRDITAALADTPENADILDKLYTELADANIQITTAAAKERDIHSLAPFAAGAVSERFHPPLASHLREALRTGRITEAMTIFPWLKAAGLARLGSLLPEFIPKGVTPKLEYKAWVDARNPRTVESVGSSAVTGAHGGVVRNGVSPMSHHRPEGVAPKRGPEGGRHRAPDPSKKYQGRHGKGLLNLLRRKTSAV